MPHNPGLQRRQIWATPTQATSSLPITCSPFTLPSAGYLNIGHDIVLTLTEVAVFQPQCTDFPNINSTPPYADSDIFGGQHPFYASTSPQIYAVAAATVISYMLVIILFITPRTFFVGGVGGGGGFLGQRGMISGASGSASVIGVGSRPALQKVATLTVAISLSFATVETFVVAQAQYNAGYEDSTALTNEVVNGLAIRIIRIISDTFLWLAQAQTLIRLFPRYKEKIIIKWTGFCLISLDTLFSILDSFVYQSGKSRPRSFDDAIPALSYLFASALSLVYAAWVIFYSLRKGRFAFYHPKMRNIWLIAMLSFIAILIPLVFFILDIAMPDAIGWGSYARWVGAAAASVVVWEWVERIEVLERDERKDGILGREIFDGDEMLDVTPSSGVTWPNTRRNNHWSDGPGGGGRSAHAIGSSTGWNGAVAAANQFAKPRQVLPNGQESRQGFSESRARIIQAGATCHSDYLTPPSAVPSPVSRADTTSAASTVYVVHYHPVSESEAPPQETLIGNSEANNSHREEPKEQPCLSTPGFKDTRKNPKNKSFLGGWQKWPSLFTRNRTTPPPEVSQGFSSLGQPSVSTVSTSVQRESNSDHIPFLDKMRGKRKPTSEEAPLPIIIVPAPPPSGRTSFIDKSETSSKRNSERTPEPTTPESPSK